MTRGGVYKRGRIWWIRYYWKRKEHNESSRSESRADAEAFLARRLGEIGADYNGMKRWLGPASEKVLITDLLDDLVLDYEVRGVRALKSIMSKLRTLSRIFDQERVRDVDSARLRSYIK